MTRRDYIMLTRILRETRPRYNGVRWPVWVNIRDRIGEELEKRNPNFDRALFNVETLRK
jgi:uncharacterized protein with HEPN domain